MERHDQTAAVTSMRENKSEDLGEKIILSCVRFMSFQVAGNPDQQEDPLDDQYQEEVEDEVCNSCSEKHACVTQTTSTYFFILHVIGVIKAQEDIAGGQKREGEVEEEDPYNEENIDQVGSSAGHQSQNS